MWERMKESAMSRTRVLAAATPKIKGQALRRRPAERPEDIVATRSASR